MGHPVVVLGLFAMLVVAAMPVLLFGYCKQGDKIERLERLLHEATTKKITPRVVYYGCEAGIFKGVVDQVTLDGNPEWVVPVEYCYDSREGAKEREE